MFKVRRLSRKRRLDNALITSPVGGPGRDELFSFYRRPATGPRGGRKDDSPTYYWWLKVRGGPVKRSLYSLGWRQKKFTGSSDDRGEPFFG